MLPKKSTRERKIKLNKKASFKVSPTIMPAIEKQLLDYYRIRENKEKDGTRDKYIFTSQKELGNIPTNSLWVIHNVRQGHHESDQSEYLPAAMFCENVNNIGTIAWHVGEYIKDEKAFNFFSDGSQGNDDEKNVFISYIKNRYDKMWRGVYGTASLNAFPNFKNKNIVNHILYRVVSTEDEPEPRFVAVGRITGENNEFKPSTSMLMSLFQILLRLEPNFADQAFKRNVVEVLREQMFHETKSLGEMYTRAYYTLFTVCSVYVLVSFSYDFIKLLNDNDGKLKHYFLKTYII